ncbi:unnamed protein product, partial [marine sediment metagenome]
NSWANESRLILWQIEDGLDWRSTSAYNLSQHGGIGYVAWANRAVLAELIEAVQYFVYGLNSSFDYGVWSTVHSGLYFQESAVTYKQIVEAWIKDDFEGRAITIATLDRMRQILWDEPFNVKWAARPESQVF